MAWCRLCSSWELYQGALQEEKEEEVSKGAHVELQHHDAGNTAMHNRSRCTLSLVGAHCCLALFRLVHSVHKVCLHVEGRCLAVQQRGWRWHDEAEGVNQNVC